MLESIRAGKRLKPVVVKEEGRSPDSGNSLMQQLMVSLQTRRTNMGLLGGVDQTSENTPWETEEEWETEKIVD